MRSPLFLLIASLVGCSGGAEPDPDPDDTGTLPPRRAFADLPDDAWSFVPVTSMVCADGSTTGLFVRPGRADRLAVLLGGLDACDTFACTDPFWWLLTHIDPELQIATLEGARISRRLADAAQSGQPLAQATLVYVPYCTADLYIGQRDTAYDPRDPETVFRHRGGEMLGTALAEIRAEIDDPDQVWAIGWGAGGFGVQAQAHRFADAWSGASLAVLADSAPMIDGDATVWERRLIAWGAQLPAGCADCRDGLRAILEHQLATLPGVRFGLATYRDDQELDKHVRTMGIDYRAAIASLIDTLYNGDRAAAFLVDGTEHLVFGQNDLPVAVTGAPVEPWFAAWANGGAAFKTER